MANWTNILFLQNTLSKGVNPDIDSERKVKSFSVEKLTNFLDGSAEKTKKRRRVEKIIFSDPIFMKESIYFMNQNERYEAAVQKTVRMKMIMKQMGWTENGLEMTYCYRALGGDLAFNIHSIFQKAIMGLGSDEQIAKWIPPAQNFQIIGTYAQTELGHGTYLQGLETTATFDSSTQEFVLNTPKLTATKWWPGDLGRTATHALVLAQLYSGGKCQGMHAFIVPIRSLHDHSPLPGITVGDIGPKMSFEQTDNGFLQLNNVRVPLENMLSRFSQVLPDGTYLKQGAAKSNYLTMVLVRAQLLSGEILNQLKKACIIAIRYSVIRHQSKIQPSDPEVKIFDYQTQQQKLLPQLATAYSFHFTAQSVSDFLKSCYEDIVNGHFTLLPELHALTSGVKAMVTETTTLGTEICRRACGGHGYSLLSGLPSLVTKVMASCTYEGENTVLYLQTARFLLKNFMQVQSLSSPETLPTSVRYLASSNTGRCQARKPADFLNPTLYTEAFKHVSLRLIQNAALKVRNLTEGGTNQYEAWNQTSVLHVFAAKAHCHYFVVKTFVDGLMMFKDDPELYRVMKNLCDLYALDGILSNTGDFLHDNFMSGDQVEMATEIYLGLLAVIRKDAVLLTDAFDFSDESLNSALGCYDGNVYERLFKWAQKSPTNTQGNPAFEKYLKPLLQSFPSKL
ncbi:peroxisomal acyl-coenzyme A oxidase 2 isoform X1 [Ornithorhynchus anatinus]|uniref:Acyl-coenzyme A oxidase n=2 Tax=Ornithorhynchus anatinus TaxID=9258 RepID=F6TEW2_ORNAN|nr:peroxisomal acyl-coenzyme A oxidase 2 isoform X1 [Ornithorhynchus anatinus]XP_028907495.1 peroxisomal acyl-coenzyme A oxidase 2 isoform X1 [Ornithorhynchus anatinus]XP_028907496.1 peroxisomal acyl-coenzyme A oxidase 2 isoform X1 [Ornithorhynchus anatinus]